MQSLFNLEVQLPENRLKAPSMKTILLPNNQINLNCTDDNETNLRYFVIFLKITVMEDNSYLEKIGINIEVIFALAKTTLY